MLFLRLAPYELSLLVTLACLMLVWQRRRFPGARMFLAALACELAYTIGYLGELLATTVPGKTFWDNVQWLPCLAGMLFLALFAREYAQKKPLPAWLLLQLGCVPVAVATLAYSNDWHHYVGSGHRIIPGWPVPALTYEFGPVAWVAMPYLIGLALQSVTTLFFFMLKRRGVFRRQALGILIGFLVPMVAYLATLFGLNVYGYRDVTPQALAFSNVFILWSLLRYRALQLLPFAREQVFDQIQGGVLVLDTSRQVVDANAAMAALLRIPLPKLLGESATVALSRWPTVLAAVERNVPTRSDLRDPDSAQERWLQVDIQAVSEGGQAGLLLLTRDITELKLATQEAMRSREAAIFASTAKSRFVATLSHEIRTPLAGVMGLSRLLGETKLDVHQRDLLQKLDSATRHMLELLNHTLDFSKLEAGRLELSPIHFDLGALLTSIAGIFFPTATDKGLRFSLVVDPTVPQGLYGDGLRLKQILANLIGNAVKFTHRGEIGLHVSVREQQSADVELLFVVTDTGIGLGQEQVQALFRPFSQADATISHRFGGTGLGLSISHQLAQMFGGSLTCESTKGVGSTFRLTVRLRISDRPVETKPAMPSENTSMASAPSAPLSTSASEPVTLSSSDSSGVASERPKVLLAEDNQVNQLITQKMLRRIGYDCDIANNGGEAVQKLNSHPFDYYAAVLMDLQMPDVDGRTAVIQLRADPRYDALPIIALTGESVREVILDVLSCGMDDVLHKPVDLKTLGDVLKRLIREKRSGRDARSRDSANDASNPR